PYADSLAPRSSPTRRSSDLAAGQPPAAGGERVRAGAGRPGWRDPRRRGRAAGERACAQRGAARGREAGRAGGARRMTRFLVAIVLLATAATGIAVGYERYRHRQLFVELTRLERQRDELNIEFGRLQLEQATWAQANRIDQVARERLGMKFPEADDIVVVRQ